MSLHIAENAHGGTLGHLLPMIADIGHQGVRTGPPNLYNDVPEDQRTIDHMITLLSEFENFPALKLIWLVPYPSRDGDLRRTIEAAQLGASSPAPICIEGLNEIDLDWSEGGKHDVEDLSKNHARAMEIHRAIYAAVREINPTVPVTFGSISNPHKRGKKYLEACQPQTWPEDLHIAFHRYPYESRVWQGIYGGPVKTPHLPTFFSREDEFTWLMSFGRRLWCTEGGYHVPSWGGADDTNVKEWARQELELQQAHGVLWYTHYQLTDGADPATSGEHWGSLYYSSDYLAEPDKWKPYEKPVVETWRQWTRDHPLT